jgi:hypothetical protein
MLCSSNSKEEETLISLPIGFTEDGRSTITFEIYLMYAKLIHTIVSGDEIA